MPVLGSSPGPSWIDAAAAVTPSRTWSKIFLCAYNRVPAQHTWPALKKIALAAPPTTVLISASGRKEGAKVLTGGDAPSSPGFFVKPTVLANVRPDMKVVREEIFGPVLVAQRFEDLDDLAALANDTPYGLGASVWSNDLRAVQRLVPKIRAGTVWVNCHNFVDPNMPFGGFKQSGFGREHGRAVLDLYTELKSVCMAY